MADRKPVSHVSAQQLVRRATLGNDQALVEELSAMSRAQGVDYLLAQPLDTSKVPAFLREKKEDDAPNYNATDTDKEVTWWIKKAISSPNPLQDRMAWFFQNFLTSHRSSGSNTGIGDQIDIFRANSLGNFRTLLNLFLKDRTLIIYLNGDRNTAKNPNENLARELLELFSLGVGNYTETDVRNGALGLAGWRSINKDEGVQKTVGGVPQYQKDKDGKERVDKDGKKIPVISKDPQKAIVELDPKQTHTEAVAFLGESKVWDVDSITDRVCDHPATHARIASLLWYHLAGVKLDANKAKSEGSWWAQQDLEIKPLVKRILNDPSLATTHYARPKSGFEYYCAAVSAAGIKDDEIKTYFARDLGQCPYEPPNVAGWPDDRWLDPDSMLRRSNFVYRIGKNNSTIMESTAVEEILDRCGLYDMSDSSLDIINSLTENDLNEEGFTHLRWRVILSSPEFNLS